jgi:hypothetical protein
MPRTPSSPVDPLSEIDALCWWYYFIGYAQTLKNLSYFDVDFTTSSFSTPATVKVYERCC